MKKPVLSVSRIPNLERLNKNPYLRDNWKKSNESITSEAK